jgi:folate-dependent phosphoribosylglycinamide formyltransferase PurN
MLKMACLIRERPPIVWFVNNLHKRHPISLLVVERRVPGKGFLRKLSRLEIGPAIAGARYYAENRFRARDEIVECNRVLGDGWQEIDKTIPTLFTSDINAAAVANALREMSPDVLVDHGTSLVKDNITATAPVALNLHWGLSPYYRGGNCTEWALILWDPLNIGVTIHSLAKRIDGGDIVAQARARVTAQDTATSLNLQLSKLGTDLMGKALDRLALGRGLVFHPQDFSQGPLLSARQWSPELRAQVRRIEKHGLVAVMLGNPSRRSPLPIVESLE